MKKDKELKKELKNEKQENLKTGTEKPEVVKQETETEEEERDPYEGYSRDDPPPWMDEFEYIDFMMTH